MPAAAKLDPSNELLPLRPAFAGPGVHRPIRPVLLRVVGGVVDVKPCRWRKADRLRSLWRHGSVERRCFTTPTPIGTRPAPMKPATPPPLRIHTESTADEVLPPDWEASPWMTDLDAEPSSRLTAPTSSAVDANYTTVTLADRLGAVLRGGAQAVGGDRAALYLLNDATTELRLSACWGLDSTRWEEAPRPLAGAIADLEALAGSAIVLEDDTLHTFWCVPEPSGAAVCVPVATSTHILGTLWIFNDQPRLFDDRETNLIEIVAGRLAADVQLDEFQNRPMIHGRSTLSTDEFSAARELQISQLPSVAPLCDDIDVAGWSARSASVLDSFHDWVVDDSDKPLIMAGQAMESFHADPLHAALVCQSLKAAVRAHAAHTSSIGELMSLANATLSTIAAGDQFASLAIAKVDPVAETATVACAGEGVAIHVTNGGAKLVDCDNLPLGLRLGSTWRVTDMPFRPGEYLLLAVGIADEQREAIVTRFADKLRSRLADTPPQQSDRVVELLREAVAAAAAGSDELRLSIINAQRLR